MHAAGLWDPRSVWAGCTDRLLLGIVTAVGRRGPLLFGVLWRASTGSWLSSFPSAAVVPSPRRQPQPLQFSYTTGVVALALGMGKGGWGHCVVLLRAAAPTTMFSSSSFAGASCLCLPLGGRRCGAWLLGASPLRGRWGGGLLRAASLALQDIVCICPLLPLPWSLTAFSITLALVSLAAIGCVVWAWRSFAKALPSLC